MELLGVHLPQGRREFRDRKAALRSLLGGRGQVHRGQVHRGRVRVKMLDLCRKNIARFFHKHEARERAAIVRDPAIMTITAAADQAPAQSEEDLSTPALRGHVLGNVPVASVRADAINGDPNITTNQHTTPGCDPGEGQGQHGRPHPVLQYCNTRKRCERCGQANINTTTSSLPHPRRGVRPGAGVPPRAGAHHAHVQDPRRAVLVP
jgi:hypothetical protein